MQIDSPLGNEVPGKSAFDGQSEEVFDLRGEDGDGDTAREAHDDGVWDKLDDGSQTARTEEDEEKSRQHGCNHEPRKSERGVADDAVDDDNERSGRSADLHAAAAESGNNKTAHDGGQDALRGRNAGSNTKSDGKRQRHDADNQTCHEVGGKLLFGIVAQFTD